MRPCRAPFRDEEDDPAGGEGEHALLRRHRPDGRRRTHDRPEGLGARRVDDEVGRAEGHVRDAPARQAAEHEPRRREAHGRHHERQGDQRARRQREPCPHAEGEREQEDAERHQVDEVRSRVELERGRRGECRRGERRGVASAAELGERAPEGERHERERRLLGAEAKCRQRRPGPRGAGADRERERRQSERAGAPAAHGEHGEPGGCRHARRPRERERIEPRDARADLTRETTGAERGQRRRERRARHGGEPRRQRHETPERVGVRDAAPRAERGERDHRRYQHPGGDRAAGWQDQRRGRKRDQRQHRARDRSSTAVAHLAEDDRRRGPRGEEEPAARLHRGDDPRDHPGDRRTPGPRRRLASQQHRERHAGEAGVPRRVRRVERRPAPRRDGQEEGDLERHRRPGERRAGQPAREHEEQRARRALHGDQRPADRIPAARREQPGLQPEVERPVAGVKVDVRHLPAGRAQRLHEEEPLVDVVEDAVGAERRRVCCDHEPGRERSIGPARAPHLSPSSSKGGRRRASASRMPRSLSNTSSAVPCVQWCTSSSGRVAARKAASFACCTVLPCRRA